MNKNRLHLLLTLLLATLLTACANLPGTDRLQTSTPITSPNDPRAYASVQLPNGLKVLVISDPAADRAAASMNIAAGSFHEPDAWPGLAHFLEHMLFLGTTAFPESDAYQRFISQNGGSHNAFTSSRDTNYFFDIQPNALDGALQRMSRFFIDPLFSPEYLEREVNAVNSEWSGTLQDDGRRRFSALRQALNPEHPAARFSAGNRESLNINNPELRPAMLAFYQQYYTTDRMTLAVLGPQSLPELRQMVIQHFSPISASQSSSEPDWPSLVVADDLPTRLDIKPLRQQYQLQLLFPIDDPSSLYRQKPDTYLAGLIGHEGEGSLLALLKDRGWATALSVGSQMHTGTDALFGIHIELTPAGDRNRDAIQSLVFAHLQLIREQGIEAWRFDEDAQLAANDFRYAEPGEARNLVTHLAMSLARYPVRDLLRAPYAYDTFDPELIRNLLDQLQPEKLLAVHVSPNAATDQTAPWVPADYQLTRPAPLIQVAAQPLTRLPSTNPFLPSSLALKNGPSVDAPAQLDASAGLAVWQGLDTSFQVPRAQLYISLQNPEVARQLQQRLLAQLTARWLDDQLNAPAYPARLAGLQYEIYPHSRGITLALGGFDAEQPRLLQQMLEQLKQGAVQDAQFARLKQSLEQSLQNQQLDRLPQQLIRQLYRDLLEPGGWSQQAQLQALQALTADDLRHFIHRFREQLHVQMLAWGNITADETRQLADKVRQTLDPSLTAADVDLLQVRQVPPGLWNEKLRLQHNDRALLFYVQGRHYGLEEEANIRLLAHLQSSAFFHELRTRQQLGYAVFNSYLPLLQQPGLFYFVQSPDNEPDYLAETIEMFLREDYQRLERLSPADFKQHQQSLARQLLEEDKQLNQRAERFWREIGNQGQDFTRRQRLAEQLLQIDQPALLAFYGELMDRQRGFYLLGTSPERGGRLLPGEEARPTQWRALKP